VDGITRENEDQKRSDKMIETYEDTETWARVTGFQQGLRGWPLRQHQVREGLAAVFAEIREIERRAGREDAAREIEAMPHDLGDEGWGWISRKADDAGWAVESVRSRRRRDDFTTATIETAYQYGYRRAAKIARGDGVQPTEEQRRPEDQKRDEEKQHD
jgi:hypothetical protein